MIQSRVLKSFFKSQNIKLYLSTISVTSSDKVTQAANVVMMQHHASIEYKDRELFGTRVGSKYEWMTYAEFGKQVQLFRNVLAHHKIGKNDKVALISNNRIEWAVAFYAVAGVGGQLVPM